LNKIIKENILYIILLGTFWFFSMPYVFSKKEAIYDWYSIKVSPLGYTPKVMKSLVKKGDSILISTFLEKEPKTEEAFRTSMEPILDKIARVCDYYKEVGKADEILSEPTWYDKNTTWSEDPSKITPDGVSRASLPQHENPSEFWHRHQDTILSALDYYKRALNYSGPELLAAERIRLVSLSVCRPQEVVVSYSTFLSNADAYVEEQIRKKDPRELRGLTEKQKQMIVLSRIRHGSPPPDVQEYLKALTVLLKDTQYETLSPIEADGLYEKILFFLQNSADPGQKFNERQFRLKRGKLLFEVLGKKNPSYIKNAILEFKAAASFENMEEFRSTQENNIMAHIFESNLYTVRCHLKLGEFKQALTKLEDMQTTIRTVDERAGKRKMEVNLLHDHHLLLRETLIKLGRKMEADAIEL